MIVFTQIHSYKNAYRKSDTTNACNLFRVVTILQESKDAKNGVLFILGSIADKLLLYEMSP